MAKSKLKGDTKKKIQQKASLSYWMYAISVLLILSIFMNIWLAYNQLGSSGLSVPTNDRCSERYDHCMKEIKLGEIYCFGWAGCECNVASKRVCESQHQKCKWDYSKGCVSRFDVPIDANCKERYDYCMQNIGEGHKYCYGWAPCPCEVITDTMACHDYMDAGCKWDFDKKKCMSIHSRME